MITPADIPELETLRGVPQVPEHHPEVDTLVHVLMSWEQAKKLTDDADVHLAVLLHDMGKGLTPKHVLPHHYGHEESGVPVVEKICDRLGVPFVVKHLCTMVCEFHTRCHRIQKETPRPRFYLDHPRFLNDGLFDRFLLACEADARGRLGFEERPYPQADAFRQARDEYVTMTARHAVRAELRALAYRDLDPKTMTPEQHRELRAKVWDLVTTRERIQGGT